MLKFTLFGKSVDWENGVLKQLVLLFPAFFMLVSAFLSKCLRILSLYSNILFLPIECKLSTMILFYLMLEVPMN